MELAAVVYEKGPFASYPFESGEGGQLTLMSRRRSFGSESGKTLLISETRFLDCGVVPRADKTNPQYLTGHVT